MRKTRGPPGRTRFQSDDAWRAVHARMIGQSFRNFKNMQPRGATGCQEETEQVRAVREPAGEGAGDVARKVAAAVWVPAPAGIASAPVVA